MIETARLRLRPWAEADRAPLAAMLADHEVMADYGGPLSRAESDAKFERYSTNYETQRFTYWALDTRGGDFVGYVGIMPIWPSHPIAPGVQIGWRLIRAAWGHGYATEAARAALRDGFARCGFAEVLSRTAPDNIRSRAVMGRLGLAREPHRDFSYEADGASWTSLVWAARPDMDFG